MNLNIVDFPDKSATLDIPAALRNLADGIEAGRFGDAHNLAWVIDQGDAGVAVGLLGMSPSPGAVAHLLFASAQHYILDNCI